MPLRRTDFTAFLIALPTAGGPPPAYVNMLPQSPVVRTSTTRASGTALRIVSVALAPPRSSRHERYTRPAG